jgi:hypothetical protein
MHEAAPAPLQERRKSRPHADNAMDLQQKGGEDAAREARSSGRDLRRSYKVHAMNWQPSASMDALRLRA